MEGLIGFNGPNNDHFWIMDIEHPHCANTHYAPHYRSIGV